MNFKDIKKIYDVIEEEEVEESEKILRPIKESTVKKAYDVIIEKGGTCTVTDIYDALSYSRTTICNAVNILVARKEITEKGVRINMANARILEVVK